MLCLVAMCLPLVPVAAQDNGRETRNQQSYSSVAGDSVEIDSSAKPVRYVLDRNIENRAFSSGEKLTFDIRYGFIKAGEAVMAVLQDTLINDSIPVYHIMTTANSASFFDNFYKVRDTVQTFLDKKGLFSWRYHKKLREGGYKFDLLVDYHQALGTASVQRIRYHNEEPLRIKNEKSFSLAIPQYVMDVLGSFYYTRTQPLRLGEPIYMDNHDNRKIYNLQVIIQRREVIKVGAGKFKCVMIKPVLYGDAIFKQKGELWVWLTDDQYRIPVQMKSKIAVGSITTKLTSIEGVPLPLPSQVK